MPFSKARRNLVDERMDAPDVDPGELARALGFIRRINRLLRYNAGVVRAVGEMIDATCGEGEGVTLLDVGAGSGDLLVEIGADARRRGRSLELIGLDRHALTVAAGVAGTRAAGIRFVRGDALALPFADASVDLVVSTMFLHHLPDAAAVAALAEMRRVARRGVVVADLLRGRRAYAWITLFTLASGPMVRHDARASVAHAFTMAEAQGLADAAGMGDAAVTRAFGHRFTLCWRRGRETPA